MVSFTKITRCAAIAFAFVAMTNCSETATSPLSSSRSQTPSFGYNAGDHFLANGNYTMYDLGNGNAIYMTSRSVCKLGQSGYGSGTWTNPCVADSSDSISITWNTGTTKAGHQRYDFFPAMRFNPNGDDVILVIHDQALANNPNSIIYYCDDNGVCVDESKTDPSLKTYQDPSRGIIWRKIRHFSGYVGSSGDCDPTVDPTCGSDQS